MVKSSLPYRSTIKSMPFFYRETCQVAVLLEEGFNDAAIKEQVIRDNIFQVKTDARKREITSTVLKRLKTLDQHLLHQLNTTDINTSKIIALFTILKTDRLFFEFINEVFKEKLAVQDQTLQDRDFNIFFKTKRDQSETIAAWKDYTFYKLQQVYTRILVEAGLLNGRIEKGIQLPLMNPDILTYIRHTEDRPFINAIAGEDETSP